MVFRKKLNKLKNLSQNDYAYLAGFIDGDGSLIGQLIKNNSYKYNFTIRISINLYQKCNRFWFLKQWQQKLGNIGSLRKKKDGMAVLTITALDDIKLLLELLLPFLIIKKKLAELLLIILEKRKTVKNRSDFLKVCGLVDKVADLTDSKKRIINTTYVCNYNNWKEVPVETQSF